MLKAFRNGWLMTGLLFLVLSALFVGQYEDDEFSEKRFFIKYRPTFKFYFYSPTGMSDLEIKDLSLEKQDEELAFEEFVLKTGVQYPGTRRDLLVPVIIQLTLTFLFYGLIKTANRGFKAWHAGTHFAINLAVTGIGILSSWNFEKGILLMVFFVLTINFLTCRLFSYRIPITEPHVLNR